MNERHEKPTIVTCPREHRQAAKLLAGSNRLKILHALLPPGMPHDVSMVDLMYDANRRAFSFKLMHPSFDEVPNGDVIPSVDVAAEEEIKPDVEVAR